jgi:type I restriction enzyme R subunit
MKYKELSDEDKREFKSILQAFLRAYTFVIQISRMMDKEMQKRYIYCKYLNTVLPKNSTK